MTQRPLAVLGAAALVPLALIAALLVYVTVLAQCDQDSSAGSRVNLGAVPAGPIGSMAWKGGQLQNAAYIMNAAAELGLSRRDQTIGVMTAMGESSLTVIDHGDAAGPDSRGLFQQRAQGWGSYACRMDPTCSATSFFRALMGVAGRDSMRPTIVAHTVQVNADAEHYTKFWPDAQQVVSALVGAIAPVEQSDLQDYDAATATIAEPGACDTGWSGAPGDWEDTIAFALGKVGVYPYSWGGGGLDGPTLGVGRGAGIRGFDCSSFVRFVVYQTTHKVLPRDSRSQASFLESKGFVKRTKNTAELQAGDIVFYSRGSALGSIYHVALVTKAGWIVEEPGVGRFVQHNPISKRMPGDMWGYARFSVSALG